MAYSVSHENISGFRVKGMKLFCFYLYQNNVKYGAGSLEKNKFCCSEPEQSKEFVMCPKTLINSESNIMCFLVMLLYSQQFSHALRLAASQERIIIQCFKEGLVIKISNIFFFCFSVGSHIHIIYLFFKSMLTTRFLMDCSP